MKRFGKWVCIIGIFSFLITGCSQQQQAAPVNGREGSQRGGDLAQGKARVTVAIKSIQGNEVTVEVLKAKEGQERVEGAGAQENQGNGENEGNQQRTLAGGFGGGSGGGMPRGGFGGRGGFSINTDQLEDTMKERYEATGEIQTLLIPIGAPIQQMGAQKELGISDLTKGSYITLIYGDENKENIIGVQILF